MKVKDNKIRSLTPDPLEAADGRPWHDLVGKGRKPDTSRRYHQAGASGEELAQEQQCEQTEESSAQQSEEPDHAGVPVLRWVITYPDTGRPDGKHDQDEPQQFALIVKIFSAAQFFRLHSKFSLKSNNGTTLAGDRRRLIPVSQEDSPGETIYLQ
ncbi:UNVERIFIED_ORG: hypothetical protein GGD59_006547 [Rhizobium esperanzae]